MGLEDKWWLSVVVIPMVGVVWWYLKKEIRDCHIRVSKVSDRQTGFELEAAKTYINREYLELSLRPITDKLVSIEKKLDKLNGA